MPVKIIAEAGVNHNGNIDLAFQLIDAAKAAGADAVKFQTFKASELVTDDAQQCAYQINNTGQQESQLAMLSRLELDYNAHFKLRDYCNQLGIEFLSSAFDETSLKFLVEDLQLSTLKIASGELNNGPFLLQHARTGCDLIISTGMATLSEVRDALAILAYGLLENETTHLPSHQGFTKAFNSVEGRALLKQKVTVLHCTTEYPAPMQDINLRVLDTLVKEFGLAVGYSDHSAGIEVSIAAVARDAVLIEKHFTLDKNLPGPDHRASLEPSELSAMISAIRNIEAAMGDGLKHPSSNEIDNLLMVRKSLVCTVDVKKGDVWNAEMLTSKRPAHGTSPMHYWDILGKPASCDYSAGALINE